MTPEQLQAFKQGYAAGRKSGAQEMFYWLRDWCQAEANRPEYRVWMNSLPPVGPPTCAVGSAIRSSISALRFPETYEKIFGEKP